MHMFGGGDRGRAAEQRAAAAVLCIAVIAHDVHVYMHVSFAGCEVSSGALVLLVLHCNCCWQSFFSVETPCMRWCRFCPEKWTYLGQGVMSQLAAWQSTWYLGYRDVR
jgi:hypothetical protein